MRLWRISTRTAFDGEGAKKHGARWNHPGTPLVYTAASLALALLEVLARVPPGEAPERVIAHYVDVPDELKPNIVDAGDLPGDWDSSPSPPALRDIGTEWAVGRSSLLLSVPSAVLRVPRDLIADERNYLINPMHGDFSRLRPQHILTAFDPRFFR